MAFSVNHPVLFLLAGCKPDPYSQGLNVDSGTKSVTIAQEGGAVTVPLYANRDWTASIEYEGEDKEWLTVAPSSGVASLDSVKLVLQATQNKGVARGATLKITSEKTLTIPINQEGVVIPEATPISKVRQMYKGTNVTIAEDIAIDGSLLVRTVDGLQTVTAADVSLRSQDGNYSF